MVASGLFAFYASQFSIIKIILVFALMGSTSSGLILSYTMVNEMVPTAIGGVAAAILNMGPYIGRGNYNYVAGLILGPAQAFAADGTPFYSI